MKKIVINVCFGGFGISEAAYEKLIEYGVPIQKYIEQKRDPETRLYLPEPLNDGEVIFDRDLCPTEDSLSQSMRALTGRYWDSWISEKRDHALLVRVVQELGDKASGKYAELKIVEIPDDVDWEIDEYDGNEKINEKHRSWN